MKRKLFALLAALLALFTLLSACGTAGGSAEATTTAAGGETDQPAYQKVTAEEARALMDKGGVLVVDVRRADEYEAGHVPGAIHLPGESIGGVPPVELPDLDAALIVYCSTGVRSREAADKLAALGYTRVIDMGGIADWSYDTVTGAEPGTYVAVEEQPGILSSFTGTDLDGNDVDQGILEGYDLIMINIWATFCGPCLREMPDLSELAAEYEAKGVRIVGLVADTLKTDGSLDGGQLETARAIVESTGANYLHLLPTGDLADIAAQAYYVPTTFFVDGDGRQVGSVFSGSLSKDDWIAVIDETLAEVAP